MMKRLTFEGNFCDIAMCQENPCPYNGSCSQKETWERLKYYEDLEEQGRLITLPCKVGTRLWIGDRKAIIEEFFGYETERYFHCQFYDNFQYIDVPFRELGKTVFLTRETAEQALKDAKI